ncbi:dTMP kinase [Hornefia porci]|uniref:Thymidylate kinase n=1 Tax=Hornefia porci TaxID=2652292 RepID=A0A1Q9JJW0_9FIRM|nr:dTMP kinase [Hornefia porci]OLR56489.1 dTMP kinase [Hornefia porci]
MNRGLFISFEGPDGSGKSTQIEYLKTYFRERGLDCVFTREPGGTEIGEKLREVILDKSNNEMCDMTEALLYAASRAQHVCQLIGPALNEGKIVVCDRFMDSSIAYQGCGRQLGDKVRVINEYAVMGIIPDLTFLLEIDPRVGKGRIRADERDRLENEKLRFHKRVYRGYLQLAEQEPQRIVLIDGSRSREEMRAEITGHIERLLEQREGQ